MPISLVLSDFSKNRQKVHEMAQTEATVTSAVKNWYLNFFPYSNRTWEMPNGAKTMKFSAKSEFFDFKVFRPPKGPRKKHPQKKSFFFGAPGGWHKSLLGPPGPHGSFLAAPSFNKTAAISPPGPPMGPHGLRSPPSRTA